MTLTVPLAFRADVEALPAILRALLDAELAAGNQLVEVGHSFPAPPVGATFLLARPVSTRDRASGGGLCYQARNSATCSGEFTDVQGRYFLLEPALPPAPEPDMDAIRTAMLARQQVADRQRSSGQRAARDLVAEFRRSMDMAVERWREGIGYDLSLMAQATPDERQDLENLLVHRGVLDWRDREALTALATPRALVVLRAALQLGTADPVDPNPGTQT